jgi:hypothetical protein
MPLGTGILIDDIIIPIDSKPPQTIENGFNRSLCRPLPVSVFNAQEHFSAKALCIEPIEQGCPSAAYMQEAGG